MPVWPRVAQAMPGDDAGPRFAEVLAMSRIAALQQDHTDYHLVFEPRPDGPTIGFYGEHPIAAAIVDHFGRRFVYDGIAPRKRDGKYDIKALRPGEWVAEPGLVYHIESDRSAKAA